MKRNVDEGLRRIGVLLGAILAIIGVIVWFGWVSRQLDFEWMEPVELIVALLATGIAAAIGAQLLFSLIWAFFYGIRWVLRGFSVNTDEG